MEKDPLYLTAGRINGMRVYARPQYKVNLNLMFQCSELKSLSLAR